MYMVIWNPTCRANFGCSLFAVLNIFFLTEGFTLLFFLIGSFFKKLRNYFDNKRVLNYEIKNQFITWS